MSRKCSHCGNNGHNSRTCVDMKADDKAGAGGGGFKLFGVRFSPEPTVMATTTTATTECSSSSSSTSHHHHHQNQQNYSNLMRKSVSMGNLSNYGSTDAGASPPNFSSNEHHELGDDVEGYASDDLVHTNSSSRERKKGVAWTEEEHRAFLMGLQKLGKGDWRGISRKFVKTRTPTQVASHAQKYFLRRNTGNKRRRRSSLFDITADSVIEEPVLEETGSEDADVCPELTLGQSIPYGNIHGMEVTQLSLRGGSFGTYTAPPQCMPLTVPESVDVTDKIKDMEMKVPEDAAIADNAAMLPGGNTEPDVKQMAAIQYIPFIPMWPMPAMNQDLWVPNSSKIVKPTPVIPRPPPKGDETMQDSDCSTSGATRPVMEPTPLSLRLQEEGTRHSAFHTASSNQTSREIEGQGNLTNAISVP